MEKIKVYCSCILYVIGAFFCGYFCGKNNDEIAYMLTIPTILIGIWHYFNIT